MTIFIEERAEKEWLLAIEKNDFDHMKKLLEDGFDIHTTIKYEQPTLHLVGQEFCFNKDVKKLIDWLIEEKYNINLKDETLSTCINYPSVIENNVEFVHYCLDKGIDPLIKDNGGDTVLLWALMFEQSELIERLLEKGADLNQKDKNKKNFAEIGLNDDEYRIVRSLEPYFQQLNDTQKKIIEKTRLKMLFKKEL